LPGSSVLRLPGSSGHFALASAVSTVDHGPYMVEVDGWSSARLQSAITTGERKSLMRFKRTFGIAVFATLLAVLGTVGAIGARVAGATSSSSGASAVSLNTVKAVPLLCGNIPAEVADITWAGGIYGTAQLSYNTCNRNAWGYGTSTYIPCGAYYPGEQGCVYIGGWDVSVYPYYLFATCLSPTNNYCNTTQWSDANIQSVVTGLIELPYTNQPNATGETVPF